MATEGTEDTENGTDKIIPPQNLCDLCVLCGPKSLLLGLSQSN